MQVEEAEAIEEAEEEDKEEEDEEGARLFFRSLNARPFMNPSYSAADTYDLSSLSWSGGRKNISTREGV